MTLSTLKFSQQAWTIVNEAKVNELIDDHNLLIKLKQRIV